MGDWAEREGERLSEPENDEGVRRTVVSLRMTREGVRILVVVAKCRKFEKA